MTRAAISNIRRPATNNQKMVNMFNIAGYFTLDVAGNSGGGRQYIAVQTNGQIVINKPFGTYADGAEFKTAMSGKYMNYELMDSAKQHFTSLFLSASSTSDELTQMPADAIPLSEIQFADNNWSIEEAIYDAPEADANGVITPTAVTGQMRIQYSLDAAEQILTLQTEYAALEARVTALENA